MIPHQLILTNFLSYRETSEINLADVHLACISGLNGAGKSTILDGITWALFGESRSSRDDDVVNRFASIKGEAAEVQYIFELEGAIYRVSRRKAVGKTTELELHLRLPENNTTRWRALTEAKLRETQAVIHDLLRMNYDIFTNASFLLQGAADEFTTKTPDKRKQILADILGVSRWDGFKAQATEKRKEVENEVSLLKRRLEEIDLELAEEPHRRLALMEAEAREGELRNRLETQEKLRHQIEQTKNMAGQQRQRLARLRGDLDRLGREQAQIAADTARRQAELAGYQALLAQKMVIEARYADWQNAETELAGWQARADRFNQLRAKRHPHDMAIAEARAKLQQQQLQLQSQRERVAIATAEREEMTHRLETARITLEDLVAQLARLDDQRRELDDLRRDLQRLEAEERLAIQEYDQLRLRHLEIQRLRDEQPSVLENSRTATERLAALSIELETVANQESLAADKREEQAALVAEQNRLKVDMTEKRDRIQQLEAARVGQSATCPTCGQVLTEDHRQLMLAELSAEGKELGDRFRGNKTRLEALDTEIQSLRTAGQRRPSLEKEREVQQQKRTRADARLGEITAALTAWETSPAPVRIIALEERLGNPVELQEVRQKIATLSPGLQALAPLEAKRQAAQNTIVSTESRLSQIDILLEEWQKIGRSQLASVDQQLVAEDFAAEHRAAILSLDTQVRETGYDEDRHRLARERRNELAAASEEFQRLRAAEAAVKPLSDALADLDLRDREHAARIAELTAEEQEAQRLLVDLEATTADWRTVEGDVLNLRDEVALAGRAVGAARQKVDVLHALRTTATTLAEEKKAKDRRTGMLKELEEACGRRGVQALLIESALPEIEDHANDLLENLTGGEMRVKFETQREQKTSNIQAETLDIKISDNSGERPYENYSGGEKFRVNFAIRIALSQVLARRSGARLRMLVIDEGFGSQDQEGRQRLVEAINAVQSEFASILVITHIDELRDKFPVRIEVEKTSRGSRVQVVAV